MDRPQAQGWGIYNPTGWVLDSTLTAPKYPPNPTAQDDATKREVLLVDQRGRPLLIREPRRVGFRRS